MKNIDELIKKYELMLAIVREVIQTPDEEIDVLTAQAVERFIKQFINDLKTLK